jgi:hypothetical protein
MSWKRGQAGGFPGLLPARWELFLPRRKARGVILGKRSSSAPDSSGIRIVPYMGRSPRPGSRGLSHMWDNPPCRRAEELCSESIPPLRRTGRESGLSRIWDDPPGRATNCPICGTIPLAEGPRSYARKASPLYAGQVGNPDCPVYGTIPRGEQQTVPYVGQSPLPKGQGVMLGKRSSSTPDRSGIRIVPYMGRSPGESNKLSHMWDNPPCRRAKELWSESIPPLRRTGRESGLSRIWDDPPGRATNCPICGTIPLAEGPECSI